MSSVVIQDLAIINISVSALNKQPTSDMENTVTNLHHARMSAAIIWIGGNIKYYYFTVSCLKLIS